MRVAWLLFVAGLVAGCQRAPSFALVGSYFPAWLIFILLATLVTIVIRFVFIRLGIDDALRFKLLVYACIALSLCFGALLLFFTR